MHPATVISRPEPIEDELLVDIATGIARATTLWQAVVCHDERERRPVRLLATERYEVWVIGWTQGQGVPLHDHGDAAGAVTVVEGTLVEHEVAGRDLRTRVLPAGDTVLLSPGSIHEVRNVHAEPATSIHVYSPPLASMTRYERDSLEPIETEEIEDEPAYWAAPAESVLRHPSTRG